MLSAIKAIKEKGYLVIVVTNQRGALCPWDRSPLATRASRGLMTEEDLEDIHQKMQAELEKHRVQVDDIFYCPHDVSDNCNCRKPEPGMLVQAQKKLDIDFGQSYIIGDSSSDVEAGRKVGVREILTTDLNEAVELL